MRRHYHAGHGYCLGWVFGCSSTGGQAPVIKVSTCQSCGAVIIWMRTKAGKTIPVDFTEDIKEPLQYDPKLHVSHFATCPQGKEWKGKSR